MCISGARYLHSWRASCSLSAIGQVSPHCHEHFPLQSARQRCVAPTGVLSERATAPHSRHQLIVNMLWDSVTTECCEVCHSCSRLLKNSIKMTPSGATNQNRVRAFAKRPLSQNLFFGDKENCKKSSTATTTEETQQPAFPSPSKQISPSKYAVARNRHPLEDHDPNSQDSGYGAVNLDKDDQKHSFRFTEPLGTAPRRSIVEQSPRKDHFSSPRKFVGNPAIFRSLSSSSGSESLDDGFMEIFESEKMDEDAQLPSGLNSLLSGTIRVHGKMSPLKENGINSPLKLSNKNENMKSPEQRKIIMGRSLSFSGSRKQVRSCLFSSDNDDVQKEVMSPGLEAIRSFKRPEPPCGFISPLETKRRKSNSLHCIAENQILSGGSVQGTLLSYGFERQTVKLQRSFSETEATIKSALQKASQQPDLIGDFSKPFILPLMCGRHQDLKAISPDTLASLLNGNYSDSIDSFTIIDCRYPYEFEGGHIRGAKNVYTKDQIWKEFVEIKNGVTTTKDQNTKRNILIFHCEFSSERGPCLSRFLRNCDRTQNKECYPSLNYPEVYLLDGGYKNFFEKHSEMCDPCSYQPMHDPKFESDLRKFRAKSKSWNGDNKTRLAYRSNLKRLGL